MFSLFVLLYVLIIAIFKTIVFFICAISVFFDNMLNKIKSNQIKQFKAERGIGQLQPHPQFFFKKVEIFISSEVYTYVVTAC